MLDQDVVVVGHITKYVSKYQPVINYTFVLEMLCRYLDILKIFFCIFIDVHIYYLSLQKSDHQIIKASLVFHLHRFNNIYNKLALL